MNISNIAWDNRVPNIACDTLTRKNYSWFFWNSDLMECLVFLPAESWIPTCEAKIAPRLRTMVERHQLFSSLFYSEENEALGGGSPRFEVKVLMETRVERRSEPSYCDYKLPLPSCTQSCLSILLGDWKLGGHRDQGPWIPTLCSEPPYVLAICSLSYNNPLNLVIIIPHLIDGKLRIRV